MKRENLNEPGNVTIKKRASSLKLCFMKHDANDPRFDCVCLATLM
jgi:hypothetical protein